MKNWMIWLVGVVTGIFLTLGLSVVQLKPSLVELDGIRELIESCEKDLPRSVNCDIIAVPNE